MCFEANNSRLDCIRVTSTLIMILFYGHSQLFRDVSVVFVSAQSKNVPCVFFEGEIPSESNDIISVWSNQNNQIGFGCFKVLVLLLLLFVGIPFKIQKILVFVIG